MKNRVRILCVALILGIFILITPTTEAETSYPYLIKVNRKQCVVTIYEKDETGKYTIPVKAMLCSPGWDTPLGTFKTPEKYRWRLLWEMSGDSIALESIRAYYSIRYGIMKKIQLLWQMLSLTS